MAADGTESGTPETVRNPREQQMNHNTEVLRFNIQRMFGAMALHTNDT